MTAAPPRDRLAERIAGEVVVSDDPGATLRKWRTDFDVSQTDLATELEVSPSVLSDYENGRRNRPGIGFVNRYVEGLLAIDDARGGDRIRQFARVLSAGFSGDAVIDIREYDRAIPIAEVFDAVDATTVAHGDHPKITGHTIIDSIDAITSLSSDEFYRLYGHSTNRLLVFTNVTTGEGPQVAIRVVEPTPTAVLLHGIEPDTLWPHATALATRDGYTLAVTDHPLEATHTTLADRP
ncbi:MAG: helix-turn-helix domain-containing protein [Halobacteriaceae archaeon]